MLKNILSGIEKYNDSPFQHGKSETKFHAGNTFQKCYRKMLPNTCQIYFKKLIFFNQKIVIEGSFNSSSIFLIKTYLLLKKVSLFFFQYILISFSG